MGYERYPRNSNSGDYYNPSEPDDRRDYGYRATGQVGRDDDRPRNDDDCWRDDRSGRSQGAGDYRPREYGYDRYAQRDRFGGGDQRSDGSRGRAYDRGSQRDANQGGGDYGRQPQGYDYRERGFFDRAGDEVRSWFGDDDAGRRRDHDARHDAQGHDRHDDYHHWRREQVSSFDRDYDEYRRENRTKFANEFATWRTERQGQRSSLEKVTEHQDVVGSDGAHVGTVDKVRGDRIILTKSDTDAGGRHHSIPSRWIQSVDDKVTLRKTADEAHAHWRDEERNQALFNEQRTDGTDDKGQFRTDHNLNRSFSGTY